jgi:hypothetical protein
MHMTKSTESAVKIKLIFLVGCPRSDTTLLQKMLDVHSEIAVTAETFFIRNFYLNKERYSDLSDPDQRKLLVEDITISPEFVDMGLCHTTVSA